MNNISNNHCQPKYKILTEDQIKRIHLASLEVLETVGVRVFHEEGIQLLKNAGCQIKKDNTIQIPNWLVEESIHNVPNRIYIYDRNGKEAMRLEGNNIYFGLGTDLIRTYDLKTREIRRSRLQDVVNAAIVADYCKEIDFIASFALPQDVPTNMMYIQCVKAQIENSVKPIFFTAAGYEDLSVIIKIAEIVSGGAKNLRNKPFLIHYSEPTAPLTHSYSAVNKLFLCAEKGIPICYTPGDMLGASIPVTLAGGIVQANAEALSGLVLHQLKRKGSPIISGIGAFPLDMKTSTISYGAPELRLTNSAFADLYHYYGIPMWSTTGSDAHCLDQQAGIEHAFGILLAALDGANLIHDVGYLGQGLLSNPATIVMCNEIISYVKRFIRGFDIDRETLGLDVIQKVGTGGNFLAEEHTLKHFRQELWRPNFFNREDPESWIKKGGLSYGEVINQKTIEILENHKPEPLPEDMIKKINDLIEKNEKELINKKFVA